jgi:hypothetical protein
MPIIDPTGPALPPRPIRKKIFTREELFEDFEPYHCGEPAFPDDILTRDFLTIGPFQKYPSNIAEETKNIEKVEASKLVSINGNKVQTGYQIENKFVIGCKKGTVVLADRPGNASAILDDGEIGKFDFMAGGVIIRVAKENSEKVLYINGVAKKESEFKARGLVFPKKLGVVLVGAGGGAGGGT